MTLAYLPELLGLVTALCYGTSDFLSRGQSLRVGYYRTTLYVNVTTVVALLILLPLLRPPLDLTPASAGLMSVFGLVFFLAFVFVYRALQTGVVSVVAPIAYTYPAITVILAVLLLGAALSYQTVLALSAIIVGVVLLSTRFSELRVSLRGRSRASLTAGTGSATIAAFAFGTVYLCVGYVSPIVGYFVPALFLRAVGVIAAIALAPLLKESIKPNRASVSRTVLVMGALEAFGFLAFSYAVTIGGTALPAVAAISGIGAAVVVAYAMVLLRERLELNQWVGIVLALVGVFSLLYLTG